VGQGKVMFEVMHPRGQPLIIIWHYLTQRWGHLKADTEPLSIPTKPKYQESNKACFIDNAEVQYLLTSNTYMKCITKLFSLSLIFGIKLLTYQSSSHIV